MPTGKLHRRSAGHLRLAGAHHQPPGGRATGAEVAWRDVTCQTASEHPEECQAARNARATAQGMGFGSSPIPRCRHHRQERVVGLPLHGGQQRHSAPMTACPYYSADREQTDRLGSVIVSRFAWYTRWKQFGLANSGARSSEALEIKDQQLRLGRRGNVRTPQVYARDQRIGAARYG